MSSYEPGSEKDRAHRLLERCDVQVDQVYGVDLEEAGMQQITFTHGGRAQTAFVEDDSVVHVVDGWDLLAPKPVGGR
jgi:hypothetical protein